MNPRGTPRRVISENSLRIPDMAGHLPYFPAYCAFCQLSRHPHNCSPVNHEINWTVCVVLKFRSAPEHFSLPISFDRVKGVGSGLQETKTIAVAAEYPVATEYFIPGSVVCADADTDVTKGFQFARLYESVHIFL
ncbi:hypothetical protein SprV_0401517400 [Sparganum proliferum]